jgi:hypothetical protein
LGYLFVYFLKGRLPWQNIVSEEKEDKYEKIKNMKIALSEDKLCENIPKEMIQYFKHVKSLQFPEKPNY